MTPTPNTPANAGRDAASMIADHSRRAPNAPLSEEWIRLTIREDIDKAIERDRAERDAELASIRHHAAEEKQRMAEVLDQEQEALAKCKAKLAEQSAELLALRAALTDARSFVDRYSGPKALRVIRSIDAALNSPTQGAK